MVAIIRKLMMLKNKTIIENTLWNKMALVGYKLGYVEHDSVSVFK